MHITFDSFASSLRSVTAALEDQRKLTDLRESPLAEARDQATTQPAQLWERDNTILNQRIDLLRAEEKNRELEERLRKAEETARRIDLLRAEEKDRELEERLQKAEEAARAAVNELWETRFEMAKDEFPEEMRNIVSSTASGADQRIPVKASPEISQLSLHEGCQLNAIWKCLVVLYHIMFKIEGVIQNSQTFPYSI